MATLRATHTSLVACAARQNSARGARAHSRRMVSSPPAWFPRFEPEPGLPDGYFSGARTQLDDVHERVRHRVRLRRLAFARVGGRRKVRSASRLERLRLAGDVRAMPREVWPLRGGLCFAACLSVSPRRAHIATIAARRPRSPPPGLGRRRFRVVSERRRSSCGTETVSSWRRHRLTRATAVSAGVVAAPPRAPGTPLPARKSPNTADRIAQRVAPCVPAPPSIATARNAGRNPSRRGPAARARERHLADVARSSPSGSASSSPGTPARPARPCTTSSSQSRRRAPRDPRQRDAGWRRPGTPAARRRRPRRLRRPTAPPRASGFW